VTWQLNPFSLMYFLSTLLVSLVFIYTLLHQQVIGSRYFIYLAVSVITWSFFTGLEYAVIGVENKLLFAKSEYFGITTIGVTWYLFALNYSRKDNQFNKKYLLYLIVPAVATLLAFTNESHGLIWSQIVPLSSEPGAQLVYTHGPAFWVTFV